MKKKYFFGILLSLFLLCGGVFLLASKNLNDQNVIEAADVDITCTYNSAYGYAGKLGATIQMEHMLSEADGSGHDQDKKSYTLNSRTSLPIVKTTSHDNFPLRRGRKIWVLSVTYPSGLSNGRITINGNLYNLVKGTTLTYDVGFWDQSVPGNFSVNLYYNVFLTLDYNGGEAYNGTNSSIIYDTYDQRMELSDGTAKTTLALPKRDGYTFKGYYTSKSNGIQVINKNGNWTNNWSRSTQVTPTTLYAQWEPKTYRVDTNILNPSGVQDYNSGTMTQSYDGQTETRLTDQAFSDIKADTILTISNIVPATGMYVSSITVNKGSVSIAKSNGQITGCAYIPKPSILGDPAGSSSWDAVINIQMRYINYSVIFNANGGSGTMSDQSFTYGTPQNLTKNSFIRAGYTFAGWNRKSDGTGDSYSDQEIVDKLTNTNNATVTLYAQWQVNNMKANLNYMGGDQESQPSSVSQQYSSSGTKLSLPSPIKTGYTFNGWSLTSNGTGEYNADTNWNNITVTTTNGKGSCSVSDENVGNIEFTLYAIWEANDYDVTLNDGSGAISNLADMPWIGNATVSDGTYSYTSGNLKIDYNAKTKDLKLNGTPTNGFILFLNKGLSFKEGGQFKIEITHKSGSMLSWAGNGYFVFEVCDQNGNNFSTNRQYLDLLSINSLAIGSTYSDTLTINANSAKLGKGLKVWYYAAGTPASQMITNYEVNFKITKLGDSQNANKKVVATYDSPMNVVAVPSKFGHTFNGYFDKVSDGTKYYDADGTSDRNWDKANTATLHAQWTPYSYTLTLEGNGGTTANGQAGITTSGSYTSNLKLQSKPFTRAGYIFKGWSTTKNGAVIYLDGANYSSLITNNNISITLYAQWQKTIASDIESTYSTAGTYYINTAADLAKLIYTTENKAVGNGYIFIQTANIDLSGLTYLPIGRLNSFSGTYDGQGYTISGIRTYNGIDVNGNYLEVNGGLFANAGGAKIKNVIIEDAEIYGQNAGIIAGSGNASTKISNCVVSGTVNGINAGSIIGNGNGASISVCLAKGVNTASFAGGSANVDSCIYELNNGNRGQSGTFTKYSEWIYPSNFAYPMPKAFMWYPGAELSESSLEGWIDK